jgi:hypothetical protein
VPLNSNNKNYDITQPDSHEMPPKPCFRCTQSRPAYERLNNLKVSPERLIPTFHRPLPSPGLRFYQRSSHFSRIGDSPAYTEPNPTSDNNNLEATPQHVAPRLTYSIRRLEYRDTLYTKCLFQLPRPARCLRARSQTMRRPSQGRTPQRYTTLVPCRPSDND